MTNKTEQATDTCLHCGGELQAQVFSGERVHPYRVVCLGCGVSSAFHGNVTNAWNSILSLHHPEPAADMVEAVTDAVAGVLHGPGLSWFNEPEVYAFAEQIARAALSAIPAPSGEPVGWLYTDPSGKTEIFVRGRWCFHEKWVEEGWTETPLYAAPRPTPAQIREDALREAAAVCLRTYAKDTFYYELGTACHDAIIALIGTPK